MTRIHHTPVELFQRKLNDAHHAIDDALESGLVHEDVMEANHCVTELLDQYEKLSSKPHCLTVETDPLSQMMEVLSNQLFELNLLYRNELTKKQINSSTLH